ncbi:ATPase [Tritrichomonas foetus]|uniref:ATPase n=1 Tax=Tritrichomonas foetus TaxID=1144522 RepID=A0A1J4KY98_9EUKA|nr:ATPase [Tritrichomonas foetus]|eukprot:OHT15856.1 ATPase [Tritrichomonas foetus]
MLFFLLSSLYLRVTVNGFVPSVLRNDVSPLTVRVEEESHSLNHSDIYVIEHPFRFKYAKKDLPLCKFKEKIPKFRLFKKQNNKNNFYTNPIISVPRNLPGSFSILSTIRSFNISVAYYTDLNLTYIILPKDEGTPNHYREIPLNSSPFYFLKDLESEFFVFSKHKSFITRQICTPSYYIQRTFTSVIIFLIIFFICIGFLLVIPHFQKVHNIQLWIHDDKCHNYYGPSFSILDDYTIGKIQNHIKVVQKSKGMKSYNTAIKIHRSTTTIVYERLLVCQIVENLFITVLWNETLLNEDSLDFSFDIESENSGISEPVLTFSSYREYRPIKISFTTENNINCVIELPAAILATFQPFGQLVSLYHTLMDELLECLNGYTIFDNTFVNFSNKVNKLIGSNKNLIFKKNGRILYHYCAPGYQIHFNEISISHLVETCSKIQPNTFIHDFLKDGDDCFIAHLNDIFILFTFTPNKIDIYENSGCIISSLFLLVQHQFIDVNILKVIVERFYESIEETSKRFILIQFGIKSRYLLNVINSSIPNAVNVDEYILKIRESGHHTIDMIMKEAHDIVSKGGGILGKKNNTIDKGGILSYYTFVGNVDFDPFLNEYVATFFIENVTEKNAHEKLLLSYEKHLQQASDSLNIHKLIITDGKIKLADNKLFEEIGQPNESLFAAVIDSADLQLLPKIIKGNLVTIRLINGNGNPVYYSALSNGTIGMIFCINDLDEISRVRNNDDDGIQLAASSAQIIVWTVDMSKDTVHSLFMQPTIWDVLSTYPDTKFSSILDFIHNDDHFTFSDGYRRLMDGELDQWAGDVRLIRMNGSYEWHRFLFSVTSSRFIHCLACNIQKQKEMEAKLEDTHRLRDLLMSSGKLSLWQFDDDNTPIEAMSRFDPGISSLVKINWSFIENQVPLDYKEQFINAVNDTLDNDKSFEVDLPIQLDNFIWISLRGKKSPNSRQIFGVCIDVTDLWKTYTILEEEKKAAELANAQKTVFLSNMSHEIRTPMNGIFGMLDVLALQDLTSEQRLLVESLRSSSSQLMRLLDDTLNLAKIESGSIDIELSVFSITKLIEPICIASGSSARLRKLNFNVIIDKSFPSLLYGDPQLLMQVVNNLVSNALKFTTKGSVTLSFQWVESENKELCVVTVKDTGIGIPPERQQIIFERFQQADANVQRFYGGTGLGLALVSDICGVLGGSIRINSEPGSGSEFICEIPMESAMVIYSPPFCDQKSHVLMVSIEDQLLLHSIQEWMTLHRYTVQIFSDPEEIITTSRKPNTKIDAILVEGYKEYWTRIKHVVSRFTEKEDIPIVCSICDAGEPISFKYNLAKPLIMEHLLNFMNSVRYGKLVDKKIHEDQESKNMSQKNILIVEDNKANQFVMSKIMKNLGCSYQVAENGQEAIDKLDKDTFDLVFMDCQMPVLDGVESTKIIRSSKKVYSSIPIIALTASAIEGDEKKCLDAGMDNYLPKPVRIKQITDAINRYT